MFLGLVRINCLEYITYAIHDLHIPVHTPRALSIWTLPTQSVATWRRDFEFVNPKMLAIHWQADRDPEEKKTSEYGIRKRKCVICFLCQIQRQGEEQASVRAACTKLM